MPGHQGHPSHPGFHGVRQQHAGFFKHSKWSEGMYDVMNASTWIGWAIYFSTLVALSSAIISFLALVDIGGNIHHFWQISIAYWALWGFALICFVIAAIYHVMNTWDHYHTRYNTVVMISLSVVVVAAIFIGWASGRWLNEHFPEFTTGPVIDLSIVPVTSAEALAVRTYVSAQFIIFASSVFSLIPLLLATASIRYPEASSGHGHPGRELHARGAGAGFDQYPQTGDSFDYLPNNVPLTHRPPVV